MNRHLLIVVLTLVVSFAVAGEPAKPAKPIGTWKRSVTNGTWSIAFEENRLLIKALGPGENVSTLSVPKYEISDEGVLFGYVREGYMKTEENEQRHKGIWPFACVIKVNGETLTLSDITVSGLDAGAHLAMTGDYMKEAVESASKPQPDKEVKR